jgi:hypothetical protein
LGDDRLLRNRVRPKAAGPERGPRPETTAPFGRRHNVEVAMVTTEKQFYEEQARIATEYDEDIKRLVKSLTLVEFEKLCQKRPEVWRKYGTLFYAAKKGGKSC